MRAITLTPLAHHRLIIRRLKPSLDTILPNQKNIIIGTHTTTTIERERFTTIRQFDKLGKIKTQR